MANSFGINSVVTKKRKKYKFQNTFIHIDEVKDLGLFVELETVVSENDDYDKILEEHKIVQKIMKINPNDFISESYSDLLLNNLLPSIARCVRISGNQILDKRILLEAVDQMKDFGLFQAMIFDLRTEESLIRLN